LEYEKNFFKTVVRSSSLTINGIYGSYYRSPYTAIVFAVLPHIITCRYIVNIFTAFSESINVIMR